MEGTRTTRKSCDLCYRRKMKCDGRKPSCSNCVTYAIDCTYSAPSRTAPKKRRSYAQGEDGVGNTQNRLGRVELLVQQMSERLDNVERKNEREPLLQHEASVTAPVFPSNIARSEDEDGPPRLMVLPPLDQVMSVIHIFLQDFNSVLPLFHGDTLLRLVHKCYSVGPLQRDPVAWAAIYVVLALARRHHLVASRDVPSSSTCLSRAQSVLPRLVLDNTELLNVQVLVGIVMLLQASRDLKPALILIATTMRLAHSIGLHDQTYSAHLDPPLARQRAYVFWLAYILDKDLSLLAKQPSIQLDDDINLELPSPTITQYIEDSSKIDDDTHNVAGVMTITTPNKSIQMNYLTARIQLAAVEGGVYDYIHSTRSRKRSPEERSRALESVESALEQWKASIPSEFKASAGSREVAPGVLRFLGLLHSTSLGCTTLINQAHAWDVQWVASIRRYDSQGIEPLLPSQWDVLVGEARDLLVLFGALGETDCWIFWTTGCSYMTAMLLLTANSLYRPEHRGLALDIHLVEIGLQIVDRFVKETGDERLLSFQATCTELHQRAQQRRAEAAIMASNGNGFLGL